MGDSGRLDQQRGASTFVAYSVAVLLVGLFGVGVFVYPEFLFGSTMGLFRLAIVLTPLYLLYRYLRSKRAASHTGKSEGVSTSVPPQSNRSVNKVAHISSEQILGVANLRKTYRLGRVPVPVLHGVELSVNRGECVAILGASGSGKSTLLHLCGGLDRPDRARDGNPRPSIVFDGTDMARAGKRELDRYRSHDVGFVFQFYHLLPELSVLENVTVGAMIKHGRLGYMARRGESVKRASELLESFGLGHRLKHKSSQLSGGERQRVAIARALINDPEILLADEPTGNLDRNTGGAILDSIFEHRKRTGLTVLMVTHDERIAERADRVVRLLDGRVVEDGAAPESSADRASEAPGGVGEARGVPGR